MPRHDDRAAGAARAPGAVHLLRGQHRKLLDQRARRFDRRIVDRRLRALDQHA
jgi:hypothetical protein